MTVTGKVMVRPGGHPFRREVAFAGGLPAGEAFIIVDEGPGLSGSSMAGVAEALHARGAPADRIVFFPGHGGGPGPEAGAAQRRWWGQERCWHTPVEELHRETGHLFGGFAAVNGKLKTLAAVKIERQRHLAAKGFALPCRGMARGWITVEDGGTPLRPEDGNADFIRNRLAPYVAAAAVPGGDADIAASFERIAAALIAYVEEYRPDFPHEAIRRMQDCALSDGLPPLLHGDGRLMPGEWVRLSDGRIVKRNATGTDWDHSWPGPQSVLWDVAGAAVEWKMTDHARGLFLEVLSDRFGISAGGSALAFHHWGYCCFRLAQSRHHGDDAAASDYEMALMRMDALWHR